MNNHLIQVLWVEDDPEITLIYPMEAAQYGIELVPYNCWEAAEKALEEDFNRWSAIVLDAKCKYKHNSHDNAATFLTQAMHAIDTICAKYHRILPWYVLSGGSEEELNDLIIDSREQWDGDWNKKKYYSKTTDRAILFHRIPYHAKISPEMQIRLIYYPDVFKAINKARLDDDVEVYMEDLLVPIHQTQDPNADYNDNMTKIRKCIELIFQSMASHRILPSKEENGQYVLHDILTDKRGSINTTWCSKCISGLKISIKNNNVDTIVSGDCILPPVLKESFARLIEISASYEHAENKQANDEQKQNSRHTAEFLLDVNNAPYLLRGMTMELCNIILWYASYLEKNKDEEINALKWNIETKTS